MIDPNKTLILELNRLATPKLFYSLATKNGKLCEINILSALIEKIKGRLGFNNATNSQLVKSEVSQLLNALDDQSIISEKARIISLVGRLHLKESDQVDFLTTIFKNRNLQADSVQTSSPIEKVNNRGSLQPSSIRPLIIYNVVETEVLIERLQSELTQKGYLEPIFIKNDNKLDLNTILKEENRVVLFLCDHGTDQRGHATDLEINKLKNIANSLKNKELKTIYLLPFHYHFKSAPSWKSIENDVSKFNEAFSEILPNTLTDHKKYFIVTKSACDYSCSEAQMKDNIQLLDEILKNLAKVQNQLDEF